MWKIRASGGLCLVTAALFFAASRAADDETLVVTALPITHSIATALARDTRLTVANVPEAGRPMRALADLLERRADRYRDTFAASAAVVTIGKLWSSDPLYTAARSANIRVIDIDATKPWSTSLEGVSVALEPTEDVPWADTAGRVEPRSPSVYFWLSPANAARAAEIVARDLMRLAPDEAEQIERNLIEYRNALLDLEREYEAKLAALLNVTVAALAPEFVYLTNAFGLFVDGYFFKQDIDWTGQDLEAFRGHLRDNDIRVVIHKWEPAEPIVEAIEAADAELVVLDPIDAHIVENGRLAADGYIRALRSNLESLHAALAAANEGERTRTP